MRDDMDIVMLHYPERYWFGGHEFHYPLFNLPEIYGNDLAKRLEIPCYFRLFPVSYRADCPGDCNVGVIDYENID
jgi:hypothetical protein